MSTSSIPTSMKAYVIGRKSILWPLQVAFTEYENQPQLVTKPVPKPEENELLIKVEVYAANPTDVLHLDLIGPAGLIIGCDVVGTVVAVGRGATRHKIGDRVVGAIHGGKYDNIGSAAEYCVAADDLVSKVPESISSEDAGTFGVGLLTAAGALYHTQGVPRPPTKVPNAPWYFVSGGATSVGMFAIQLSKQAGFRVIASASPRSFDIVKRYGADHVVSYADHTAALKEIREVTQNGVVKAMDCVGGKANLRFAVDAFGPSGGDIVSILPGGKSHRSDVRLQDFLLSRYLGKASTHNTGHQAMARADLHQAFTFIPIIRTYPAESEKREWLADFTSTATEMIETYGIRPNPVEIGQGFEAIPDALKKLRVSGKKLVFKL